MSEEAKKSVINRGKRTFTLRSHADGKKRVLEPGKSIECLDDKEFRLLVGYSDVADVDAIAPQLAHRETALRAQLKKAEDENAKLKAQRAVTPAPEPEEVPVKKPEPVPEPEPVRHAAPKSKARGKKKGK